MIMGAFSFSFSFVAFAFAFGLSAFLFNLFPFLPHFPFSLAFGEPAPSGKRSLTHLKGLASFAFLVRALASNGTVLATVLALDMGVVSVPLAFALASLQ